MGRRCLTLPTLVEVGTERVWTGDGSTTQLLNGTMYEWLKLTNNFSINPRSDKAFALLGTGHHKLLEGRAAQLGLPSEVSLTGDGRNVFDLLEIEGYEYILTDYKTWGSFKVARTFGIVVVHEYEEHYTDRAGRKRKRTIKERAEVPERGDWFEIGMQLGRYAYAIQDKSGIKVARAQVQVTVRDGGIKATVQHGITDNMYLREVPLPSRTECEEYFALKAAQLAEAMSNGWTDVCDEYECWEGVRCAKFCEVAHLCPKGKQERMIRGS